jgi:hypothetical protein
MERGKKAVWRGVFDVFGEHHTKPLWKTRPAPFRRKPAPLKRGTSEGMTSDSRPPRLLCESSGVMDFVAAAACRNTKAC